MIETRTMSAVPLALLLVLAAVGCDKKHESSAATTHAGVVAASSAPPVRDPSGKLSRVGVDAAWAAVYFSPAAANEPSEKKQAAFEAKVGAPAKIENDKRVWFAVDGTSCFRIELTKDGTKGSEKVAASACGS